MDISIDLGYSDAKLPSGGYPIAITGGEVFINEEGAERLTLNILVLNKQPYGTSEVYEGEIQLP